ncbi:U32 family peptidase, partial [Acinetobacter baumannii]
TQGATEQSDSGEAIPIKLEGGFNFEQEQSNAEAQAFAPSACGNGQRHPAADNVYLIEESERPGELMPIMEDEHGTYIMNSKDLRAVEHV